MITVSYRSSSAAATLALIDDDDDGDGDGGGHGDGGGDWDGYAGEDEHAYVGTLAKVLGLRILHSGDIPLPPHATLHSESRNANAHLGLSPFTSCLAPPGVQNTYTHTIYTHEQHALNESDS